MTDESSTCLDSGPRHPDILDSRHLGWDKTEGRFADVELMRYSRGRRLWLRYSVEYEAFTSSGRWAEVPIGENDVATMTPERAAAFIAAAPWHIYGGSYWGHAGRKGSGWIHWGL